jgi:hypothetical protein
MLVACLQFVNNMILNFVQPLALGSSIYSIGELMSNYYMN